MDKKNHKTPGEIVAIFHLFMSDDIAYYGATTTSHMKNVHGYVVLVILSQYAVLFEKKDICE